MQISGKKMFIHYLKNKITEKGRERAREHTQENCSVHWFTLQVTAVTGVGPELWQKAGLEVEQPGHESLPIWNAGTPSIHFNCYAKTLPSAPTDLMGLICLCIILLGSPHTCTYTHIGLKQIHHTYDAQRPCFPSIL